MIKRNSMLLLGIVLLVFDCLCMKAQEHQNIGTCVEVDTFSTLLTRIELPCGYKKKTSNYEEGTFIDYSYSDGSIITLFKGALQKTPLLAINRCYIVNKIDTVDYKIIMRGTIGEKTWREDAFKGLRIYYDNVLIGKKELFDNVLDSLSVIKAKK